MKTCKDCGAKVLKPSRGPYPHRCPHCKYKGMRVRETARVRAYRAERGRNRKLEIMTSKFRELGLWQMLRK